MIAKERGVTHSVASDPESPCKNVIPQKADPLSQPGSRSVTRATHVGVSAHLPSDNRDFACCGTTVPHLASSAEPLVGARLISLERARFFKLPHVRPACCDGWRGEPS